MVTLPGIRSHSVCFERWRSLGSWVVTWFQEKDLLGDDSHESQAAMLWRWTYRSPRRSNLRATLLPTIAEQPKTDLNMHRQENSLVVYRRCIYQAHKGRTVPPSFAVRRKNRTKNVGKPSCRLQKEALFQRETI